MNEIRVDIKDVLPLFIQDELEDNKEDYYSLTHEDWYDLLSTIKVKDNRKRAAPRSRRLQLRTVYHSNSNEFVWGIQKKRVSNGLQIKKQK